MKDFIFNKLLNTSFSLYRCINVDVEADSNTCVNFISDATTNTNPIAPSMYTIYLCGFVVDCFTGMGALIHHVKFLIRFLTVNIAEGGKTFMISTEGSKIADNSVDGDTYSVSNAKC